MKFLMKFMKTPSATMFTHLVTTYMQAGRAVFLTANLTVRSVAVIIIDVLSGGGELEANSCEPQQQFLFFLAMD